MIAGLQARHVAHAGPSPSPKLFAVINAGDVVQMGFPVIDIFGHRDAEALGDAVARPLRQGLQALMLLRRNGDG